MSRGSGADGDSAHGPCTGDAHLSFDANVIAATGRNVVNDEPAKFIGDTCRAEAARATNLDFRSRRPRERHGSARHCPSRPVQPHRVEPRFTMSRHQRATTPRASTTPPSPRRPTLDVLLRSTPQRLLIQSRAISLQLARRASVPLGGVPADPVQTLITTVAASRKTLATSTAATR